ncbi:MAG: phage shock protein E [Motiliproteus sp.]|jgi:phage shock protein E
MTVSNRPLLALICSILLTASLPSWAESREQQAWSLIDQGALIIDVRTTAEYADNHLPQALHIPYQQIKKQFAQLEIRKDRAVVLYCRSGNRSGIAYKTLKSQGYSALYNGGGLKELLKTAH